MSVKILQSVFFLVMIFFNVTTQATDLVPLTPDQLQAYQTEKNALIIDIRTPGEWHSTGIIPNSHKLQGLDGNGNFDAEKWLNELQKFKTSPDQPVVLVCRSGNRSQKIGNLLIQQGQQQIYHLNQGIQGWIQSGHPVQAD